VLNCHVADVSLPKLSDGEIEIMKAVWAQEPTAVSEVRDEVNRHREPPLARNTILTQMQRLVKKGWLRSISVGRAHSYESTVPREKAERYMATGLRKTLFGGSSLSLVRCLLDDEGLSADEVSQLRALIDARND